ncbi:MAG: Rrf2 family transcriptional regulator [Ruminococcaceae bacterium]|nr:Rrf2 family transcriptional regulator [Oscillospiraceae bacterium]
MCTREVDIEKDGGKSNMRVTQEADYAIRMCLILDSIGEKTGAAQLADIACITPKIALKVLRKLNEGGMVRSYKGVQGGYELVKSGDELRIIEIIELIDGPIRISKCLDCEHECSKNPCKMDCKMHIAFDAVNQKLIENLGLITVRMLHDKNVSAADISDIINNV